MEDASPLSPTTVLLGSYSQGQGLFRSLELKRVSEGGGSPRYEFSAEQVVMCVAAPCPSLQIHGTWFANATVLVLRPTSGSPIDTRYELSGQDLVLRATPSNVVLSHLVRLAVIPPTVEQTLQSYGLPEITATLPADEVTKQSTAYPSTVSFDDALRSALESFLHDGSDPESPLALVEYLDPDDPCAAATPEKTLLCLVNRTDSELGLLRIGETAEHGETVSKHWIFTLSIPTLSDHGHWAVVDRQGKEGVYNYGFN